MTCFISTLLVAGNQAVKWIISVFSSFAIIVLTMKDSQVSQRGGDRLQSIIEASKIHGDNLYAELQNKIIENPIFQCQYHKSCVAKYLTKAKRLSENLKQETSALSQPPAKRTRSSMGDPFDWLSQCFYCGKRCDVFPDSKHPDRWNPAYLIRETEMKTTADGTAKKDTLETRI